MKISTERNDDKLIIALEGRIDTMTSPELEEVVNREIEGISDLTFDFGKVEYISSAGLRVLLASQKMMNKQGNMKILNVNDVVMEVFEMTGFCDILEIE